MSERKYNKEEPLNALISIRVSTQLYDKLEGQRSQSTCQTLGEFARRVLSEKEITWVHRDATMDGIAAELAGIKKEIKAIGTNINQVTRYFNSTGIPNQKIFEALKILDEYKKITGPVEKVVTIISNLKWSPK
jgi:hypothetical protein